MDKLLKKLLEYSGNIHDYVILKKDKEGFYIKYAFCEGAPHDNRCLDWYHSYQPEARKRNGSWDDELLAIHKKHLEENIGKIYKLSSFTCGGEENPETQVERAKKSFEEFYPGEKFIPQNYICKVGKPAPNCRKCQCPNWTYKEPMKCACWTLTPVNPDEITFNFTVKTLKKFMSDYSNDSKI